MTTRLSSPSLVGRRAELGTLQAAAERAAGGAPGLVLVAGEAGVGKTRLVDELAGWARNSGYQVLVGGCVSLSADVAPFAPIIEALRPLLREGSEPELGAILGAGAHGRAPTASDSTGISQDSAHSRTLELLLGVLGRLAARAPVVLVVEDIQWADRSSLDVLAFLVRNLQAEPILLLSTLRTDAPETRRELLPFIAELSRHRRVERIDLARLTRAEVAEQLSAITGAPVTSALIEDVYSRSQGNAFFSEELLAAESIAGSMPQTLRDVLAARVGALSHGAQELVRVASAAGRRFSESLLERLVAADSDAFHGALREAIDNQILVRDRGAGGEHLGFRHALVQELMYADLLPSERVRLHGVCARAIEEQPSAASDAVLASELAYHWQEAEEPERALRASIVAATAAEASGARTEAALQFERALDLLDLVPEAAPGLPMDRIDLLERAALNRLENPARGVDHIHAAIRLTDPIRDAARAGLLQAALGRYLWFSGDGPGALAACREAVALVPAQPPSVALARVKAGLAQILMIQAHPEEAVPYAQEAVRLATMLHESAIEGHAQNTLGVLTAYLGDVDAGLAMIHRALEIAIGGGNVDDIGRAYANLQDVLIIAAARFDEAGDIGLEAAASTQPSLGGVWAAIVLIYAGWARDLGGHWGDALAAIDRARLQPSSGATEIEGGIRAVQVLVGRGELEKAGRQLDGLALLLEDAVDTQWIAPFTSARAEWAIWTADPAAALQAVADGLRRSQPSFGANVSRIAPMLVMGVRAAADLVTGGRHQSAGVVESARAQAAAHLATMRAIRDEIASRCPAHLRLADPYLALCEAETNRLEGRRDPDAWARAATLFQGLSQPYPAAYARYREGEALLAMRLDAQRARSALREAHATARALGGAPLLAAIEGVAGRGHVELGEEVKGRGRTTAPGGLSTREQEILGLVAGGLTNRQIGERLFITEKTASHHVSNILAKLGVSGRAEAAAEAVRLGISPPAA